MAAHVAAQWVTLDNVRYEVLGVMPPGFRGIRPPGLMSEFWLPVDPSPANHLLRDRWKTAFEVVARLKDGKEFGEALAEMAVLAKRLKAEHALDDQFTAVEVFPVDGLGGYRRMSSLMLPLFMFVGLMTIVSGLVLLVGSANIAGLLLARFWNGEALGRRVDDFEVIGIGRDSKYWTLGERVKPLLYTSLAQRPVGEMNLNIRASDLAGTAAALRSEMRRVAPGVFVEIKPLTTAVAAAILPAQVGAMLTGAFGMLAAVLATMGIYGLVSLTVAQRAREIGIRKAVGARTFDVVRVVVRGSVTLVAIGLAIGTLGGAVGARALGGFIVGVSPLDPLTISATAALVVGTVVLASALPALRAARIDPVRTLKIQ